MQRRSNAGRFLPLDVSPVFRSDQHLLLSDGRRSRQRTGTLPDPPARTAPTAGGGNGICRALALDHRPRYLETGWIQRESRAQGLDERLFQAPESVEDIHFLVSAGCGQRAPFLRAVNAAPDTVKIPARSAHLQIHAKVVPARESDQSVLAAVAQIETLA